MSHSARKQNKVVITGAGLITPLGRDWAGNSAGFRAGKTAFRQVTLFDTTGQRAHSAAELDLPSDMPSDVAAKTWRRLDRGARMAYYAARQALDQAEIRLGSALPFCVGTSAGAMPLGQDYLKQALVKPVRGRDQFHRVELYQSQRQMRELVQALGVNGPVSIISNACSSGANAIGHGFQQIRYGRAQRVLAGGYDALCQMVFAGFDSLQALAESGIPRPFDAARDGLALGEGAGMLILESETAARARGIEILGEISGYGAATDVHHLTQPHPRGDAALLAMSQACRQAGVRPEQIGYVNSHGTGTPRNDIAEGAAICRWAGEHVANIAVSSTKSSIGHLLGGAGAVEAVLSLMVIQEQWLPASLNIRQPDEICAFNLIREPRQAETRRVLSNSFGFGGANATLILETY